MITRENKKACIAIDVSKGCSNIQGFYNAGNAVDKAKYIEHTKTGFSKILELKEFLESAGYEEPIVVFENTGTYSRPIERFCIINKLVYFNIPPLLSAKYGKQR